MPISNAKKQKRFREKRKKELVELRLTREALDQLYKEQLATQIDAWLNKRRKNGT